MLKVALLYNPLSGQRRQRRLAEIGQVADVLRAAGWETFTAPTRGPSDAADQAREAISQGCETIFACGGDGTVHDVVQGLVGTDASLGIIPFGTANVLACDLGLPRNAVQAAHVALRGQRKRIAVGRVNFQDFAGEPASRYFTAVAGVGLDAYLFRKLKASAKARAGMGAYYARAAWTWLTCEMPNFDLDFEAQDTRASRSEVSQLLAVRIRNFGGVLRTLAAGASLDRNDLRLVLFRTRSHLRFLQYVVGGFLGVRGNISGIELVHATRVHCRASAKHRLLRSAYVQADGELLGTLPAEISVIPDAVTVLVPASRDSLGPVRP